MRVLAKFVMKIEQLNGSNILDKMVNENISLNSLKLQKNSLNDAMKTSISYNTYSNKYDWWKWRRKWQIILSWLCVNGHKKKLALQHMEKAYSSRDIPCRYQKWFLVCYISICTCTCTCVFLPYQDRLEDIKCFHSCICMWVICLDR